MVLQPILALFDGFHEGAHAADKVRPQPLFRHDQGGAMSVPACAHAGRTSVHRLGR
jgi:hypothetical protein